MSEYTRSRGACYSLCRWSTRSIQQSTEPDTKKMYMSQLFTQGNPRIIHCFLIPRMNPTRSNLPLVELQCTLVIPTLSPPWQGTPMKDLWLLTALICHHLLSASVQSSTGSPLMYIHARLSTWLEPNTVCQSRVKGTTCRLQLPHDDCLQGLQFPGVDWPYSPAKLSAHGPHHLPPSRRTSYTSEAPLSVSLILKCWNDVSVPYHCLHPTWLSSFKDWIKKIS